MTAAVSDSPVDLNLNQSSVFDGKQYFSESSYRQRLSKLRRTQQRRQRRNFAESVSSKSQQVQSPTGNNAKVAAVLQSESTLISRKFENYRSSRSSSASFKEAQEIPKVLP